VTVACPRDRLPLASEDGRLRCADGHEFACPGGIPVLLLPEAAPTQEGYWAGEDEVVPADELPDPQPGTVDPYVRTILRGTCGNLYASLDGLERYPIPALPLPDGSGSSFLELGSNWGRWCIAAARRGYRPTGIDPSLGAVRAARRVARQLGVDAEYVVADARHLPFADASVDVVFSYSVLQHLDPGDVRAAVAEAARVLRPGGRSVHQLPNAYGLLNGYRQARRGFRGARAFEVRYWRPSELRALGELVGPTRLEVDGFFSLNAQPSDTDLLRASGRAVVRMSSALRRVRPLRPLADSIWVVSERRA
jgi:SAM-dependent methyltransferase